MNNRLLALLIAALLSVPVAVVPIADPAPGPATAATSAASAIDGAVTGLPVEAMPLDLPQARDTSPAPADLASPPSAALASAHSAAQPAPPQEIAWEPLEEMPALPPRTPPLAGTMLTLPPVQKLLDSIGVDPAIPGIKKPTPPTVRDAAICLRVVGIPAVPATFAARISPLDLVIASPTVLGQAEDAAHSAQELSPVRAYSARVVTTHGNYVQYPYLLPTATGLPGPQVGYPVDLDDDLVPDACIAMVVGSTFGFQRALVWRVRGAADVAGSSIEFVVRDDLLQPFRDWTTFGLAFHGVVPKDAGLLFNYHAGPARRVSYTASLNVDNDSPLTLLAQTSEADGARTSAASLRVDTLPEVFRLAHERIPERAGAILDVDVSRFVPTAQVAYHDDVATAELDEHANVALALQGVATNLHLSLDALADGRDFHATASSASPTAAVDAQWSHVRNGATQGQTLRVVGPVTALQIHASRPDLLVATSGTTLGQLAFASWDQLAEPAWDLHLTLDQPDAANGYLGLRLNGVRRIEASRVGLGPVVVFQGSTPQQARLESRLGNDALIANLQGAPGVWNWNGDGFAGFAFDTDGHTDHLDMVSVASLQQAVAQVNDFRGYARFTYDLTTLPVRAESGNRFGDVFLELRKTGGLQGTEWRRVRLDAEDAPSFGATWADAASDGRVALYNPGDEAGRLELLATQAGLAPVPLGSNYLVAATDVHGQVGLRLNLDRLTRLEWNFGSRGGNGDRGADAFYGFQMQVDAVGGPWDDVFVQDHLGYENHDATFLGLPQGAYLDWRYRSGFALRAPRPIDGLDLLTTDEAVSVRGPMVAVDGVTHAYGTLSVTGDQVLASASVDRNFPWENRRFHLDLTRGQGVIDNWDSWQYLGFSMEIPGAGLAQRTSFWTNTGTGPALPFTHRGIVVGVDGSPSIDFSLELTRGFAAAWDIEPVPGQPCNLACNGRGDRAPAQMDAEGTAESAHDLDVIRVAHDYTRRSTLGAGPRGSSQVYNFTLSSNYLDRAIHASNRTDRFTHQAVLVASGLVPFEAWASDAGPSASWLFDARLGAAFINVARGAGSAFIHLSDTVSIAGTAFRNARLDLGTFPEGFAATWRPDATAFEGTVINGTASSVRFDLATNAYADLGSAFDWLVLGQQQATDGTTTRMITLRGLAVSSADAYAGDGVDFFNWTTTGVRTVLLRSAVRVDGLRADVIPGSTGMDLTLAAGPRLLAESASRRVDDINVRWCSNGVNPDACPGVQVQAHLIRAMPGNTTIPFSPDKVEVSAPAGNPTAGQEPVFILDYANPVNVPIFETRYSDMHLELRNLHHSPGINVADVRAGTLGTEDNGLVYVDLQAWSPAALAQPTKFFPKGRPGPDHIAYAAVRDANPQVWYQYVSFLGTFANASLDGRASPPSISGGHGGNNPVALYVNDERYQGITASTPSAQGKLTLGYGISAGAVNVRVGADGSFPQSIAFFVQQDNFNYAVPNFGGQVRFDPATGGSHLVVFQMFHLNDDAPTDSNDGDDREWTHHGANPDVAMNVSTTAKVRYHVDATIVDANTPIGFVGDGELTPQPGGLNDPYGVQASYLACYKCEIIDDPPLCITCDSDLEWLHYGEAVANGILTGNMQARLGASTISTQVACGWADAVGGAPSRVELGGFWSFDNLHWTTANDDTVAAPSGLDIYFAQMGANQAYVDGSRDAGSNAMVPLEHITHCSPLYSLGL